MNGEPLYVRVYESHEAATADAIALRCDLLTAGWMSIEEVTQATQNVTTPTH